jgi:N utilization substance protein A
MKSDFLLAITQLSAEKNLSREVVLGAVEAALASAYRKNNFTPTQEVLVKINPASGKVEVWAGKTVVEKPQDPRSEMSLAEARKVKPDAQLEDVIMVEDTPRNAGRIAAQTAKQVILQRLHEAEHSAIYEEYTGKQGDIITGVVRRVELRQVFVDLGRAEAVMPVAEQAPNERYRVGQRLKVYLLEVAQTARGPVLLVSRSHPNLLRRLFELEVPEVYNGTVEIKAVAREAGYRSKVAVAARQEGIDPVGCCVGLRGIRIQNIVNELGGEKIDVVGWEPDIAAFMANALSPARVVSVAINEEEKTATVVIPDRQLSLAIGKEGQNVRLAVKLTGWRIDIRSASDAEKEKAEAVAEEGAEAGEEAAGVSEVAEPALVSAEVAAATPAAPKEVEIKRPLRFAEDVLAPAPPKPQTKDKKKKKKTVRRKGAEDGIKLKKKRREAEVDKEGDEDYY